MFRKACGLLVLAGLVAAGVSPCRGQAPAGPPSPCAASAPVPPVPSYPSGPAGPPPCAPYEDRNGPLLRGDPLLDRPEYPPEGWFGALEADIVKPHLKYALVAPVSIGDETSLVHVPLAPLDWTGVPRLELGYRFTQGLGEFLVTYRSIKTEGSDVIADFDRRGAGSLRSELDADVLDLDYGSREFSLGPWWDMHWKVGLRFADLFAESNAEGLVLQEHTSNRYWGIGPHAGLDLTRSLGVPGLAAFGRIEGAALLGNIRQQFEETEFTRRGLALDSGGTTVDQAQGVPVLSVQAGLAWAPSACRFLRFSGGYVFEEWWYLGQADASRAELSLQGLFFRGEWNF